MGQLRCATASTWTLNVKLAVVFGVGWLSLGELLSHATIWDRRTCYEVAAALLATVWGVAHFLIIKPLTRQLSAAENRAEVAEGLADTQTNRLAALRESETVLRTIYNHSPNGVVILDVETLRPLEFNDKTSLLFGYSRRELQEVALERLLLPADLDRAARSFERAIRGTAEHFTATCVTRTDTTFTAAFDLQVVSFGGRAAVAAVIHDVTHTVEAERALRATHVQMEQAITDLRRHNDERVMMAEMTGVLQACVHLDEAYRAVCRFGPQLFPATGGALYIFSASRDDLELVAAWGAAPEDITGVIGPSDCWALRRGHTYERLNTANLSCKHRGAVDDGTPYVCLPLTAQGETLGMLHMWFPRDAYSADQPASLVEYKRQIAATFADQITMGVANIRLSESLRHQSIHDPLTGLYNRRYMEENLRREVSRAHRAVRPLAVVMGDLDHFKQFNDTYGHEAGDVVLAELGLLLRQNVRAGDLACRYGGEEFALVLPDISLDHALERVESIRAKAAALRIQQRGRSLGGLTMSLGLAMLPEHGISPEELLRSADKALYRAKQNGRDQCLVAGPDLIGDMRP